MNSSILQTMLEAMRFSYQRVDQVLAGGVLDVQQAFALTEARDHLADAVGYVLGYQGGAQAFLEIPSEQFRRLRPEPTAEGPKP